MGERESRPWCEACGGEGQIYSSRYGGNDPDVYPIGTCKVCEGSGLEPDEALDDLLADVHDELEAGATAARIREIADAYPKARAEILSFAAEWFASPGSDLTDEEPDHGW